MKKVASSISTRPEPGSSSRDGRRPPLAGSTAVAAVRVQNSRTLAVVSTALAAFGENATEAVRTRAAAKVEAQVGKPGAARGDQLHEAGMEASPTAQFTGVRLADSSAG